MFVVADFTTYLIGNVLQYYVCGDLIESQRDCFVFERCVQVPDDEVGGELLLGFIFYLHSEDIQSFTERYFFEIEFGDDDCR